MGRGRVGDHIGLFAIFSGLLGHRSLQRGVLHRLCRYRLLHQSESEWVSSNKNAKAGHVSFNRETHRTYDTVDEKVDDQSFCGSPLLYRKKRYRDVARTWELQNGMVGVQE